MKTSLATTHLLCLFGGFLLSNTQSQKNYNMIDSTRSNHHLLQIQASQIPAKEKNNFQQNDKISLTLAHQKQPWCVFDMPFATIVQTQPLWVKIHSKNAITWLQKISQKTMVIPTKFSKNLPTCRKKKPNVKWN